MEKPNALQEALIRANIGKKEIHEIEFSNGIRIIILKDKDGIEVKDENGQLLRKIDGQYELNSIRYEKGYITFRCDDCVNIYKAYRENNQIKFEYKSHIYFDLDHKKKMQTFRHQNKSLIKIIPLEDNAGEIKYRVTYVPTNSVLGIYDEVKQCGDLIAGKLNGRYITFCPTVNEKGEFDTGIIDVSEQVSLIETLNKTAHATFTNLQPPRMKSRVYRLDNNKGTYEEVK